MSDTSSTCETVERPGSKESSETVGRPDSNESSETVECPDSKESSETVECPDSKESSEQFIINQIVWAKLANYPYWPSIVCVDPTTNVYVKGTYGQKDFSLHVRFCNDSGRRSWVKNVEPYSGKDLLLKKYPNCLSSIQNKPGSMKSWKVAMNEADYLIKLDLDLRFSYFTKNFPHLLKTEAEALKIQEAAINKKISKKRSLKQQQLFDGAKKIKTENMSVVERENNSVTNEVSVETASEEQNMNENKPIPQPKKIGLPRKRYVKKCKPVSYSMSESNLPFRVKESAPTDPPRKVSSSMKETINELEKEANETKAVKYPSIF